MLLHALLINQLPPAVAGDDSAVRGRGVGARVHSRLRSKCQRQIRIELSFQDNTPITRLSGGPPGTIPFLQLRAINYDDLVVPCLYVVL